MNSLGQEMNQGSFYVMDNRNFFRNPANVAKMKNFLVAELATIGSANDMEGGYFGEIGSDFSYGLYLGKTPKDVTPEFRAVVDKDPDASIIINEFLLTANGNPLNFFFGGGQDFKWGLNINYANATANLGNGDNEYTSFGVGGGIETSGGLQVYLNVPITLQSELAVATPTANDGYNKVKLTGFQAGIIYALNKDFTLFGQYRV